MSHTHYDQSGLCCDDQWHFELWSGNIRGPIRGRLITRQAPPIKQRQQYKWEECCWPHAMSKEQELQFLASWALWCSDTRKYLIGSNSTKNHIIILIFLLVEMKCKNIQRKWYSVSAKELQYDFFFLSWQNYSNCIFMTAVWGRCVVAGPTDLDLMTHHHSACSCGPGSPDVCHQVRTCSVASADHPLVRLCWVTCS